MAIGKKAKVKEFMANQMMFGNTEHGKQLKQKVVDIVQGMDESDPALIDVMYQLTSPPSNFPTWQKVVMIVNAIGIPLIAVVGFIS